MIRGFVDQWVPTRPGVSDFWRSDFDACRNVLDALIDELAVNHFSTP